MADETGFQVEKTQMNSDESAEKWRIGIIVMVSLVSSMDYKNIK